MKRIITPTDMKNYLLSEPVSKTASDALIRNIHSMEPHTAYALLGGHLAPLLYSDQKKSVNFQPLTASIPTYSTSMVASPKSATISFSPLSGKALEGVNKVKQKFKEIEDILLDLQKNAKTILQFRDFEVYKDIKELWDYDLQKDERYFTNLERLQLFKGIIGRFSVSKSLILHKLKELEKFIDQLNQFMPQSLIDSLQKARKTLLQQIPSSRHDLGDWRFPYQLIPNGGGSRNIRQEFEGEYRIENPSGLLEMVQDKKKLSDYLANIRSAFNEISIHTTTGPERAHLTLQQMKNDFSTIQKRLKDLYENRQEIIDRWIDSTKNNPIKPDDQILKDFYYLRANLQKDLQQIKDRIAQFEKDMPDSKDKKNLIAQLRKTCDDLESKIPEPNDDYGTDSGNWKPRPDALVDQKEGKERMRFWWKENDWDAAKVMKWKDSGETDLPENPLGIFEMAIDSNRSKYKDFLDTISKGSDSINEFYKTTGSKPLHLFLLRGMDTQSAYIYMIVVFLPLLQAQSAESLESQGETMKEVSKIFDKWNDIQQTINQLAKDAREIEKEGLIKQGKINIKAIEDYYKNGEHYKIVKIDDSDRAFQKLFDGQNKINEQVKELQELLKQVEQKIPKSSKSLIATLQKISTQLLLVKKKDYNFYYFKGTTEIRFEILANTIPKFTNNSDKDAMNEVILSYTKDTFGFFIDSDQTKFKAYMDNIAQGITALTSISNMTQQQLQIDTQYYNSLLGFQKSAQDALNKTIQATINNMR